MRKKRRSVFDSFIRLLGVLILLLISGYYIIKFINTPSRLQYKTFGINMPGYTIHGIDVSRYQRVIDWEDVKAMNVDNIRIGFAFIKATEGVQMVDEQFRRNWVEAENYELPKGAYHFFVPGKSGLEQARNFISIVQLKPGDLPPVLDVETAGNATVLTVQREMRKWLNAVEQHYHIMPIIYSNIEFYHRYVAGCFDNYPFWIAHYLQPERPRIDRKWSFWQHSERGHVNGIATPVDFNVFSGDSLEFGELMLK